MMEAKSLEPRVVVLETKIDGVITAVHELTKAVREIANAPKNIAWREIAITVGTMLAIFAYVGGYLEGQHIKNVAVEKHRLAIVERALCVLDPKLCVLSTGQLATIK